MGKQILRCGTSVGAQYRESQHAKSDADFVSKVEGSLQELEETTYWLELLEEMQLFPPEKLKLIQQETKEQPPSFVTIAKKVKLRRNNFFSELYPFAFTLSPLRRWLQT
jgi:four helix bundle protein